MKALKTLVVILTLTILSTSINAGNFDRAAEESVVKTLIEDYVKSINKRNADELDNLLYSNSNFIKLNKIVDQVTESSKSDALKLLSTGKLGFWKEVEIGSVNVTSQMAQVTLHLGVSKLKQVEYISLFKVDGEWKIVSVLSTLEKE